MGLFNKKADPIQSKAKALNSQIAALEVEIRKLQKKSDSPKSALETARSVGSPSARPPAPAQVPAFHPPRTAAVARDPIFESFEQATPSRPNGKDKDPHFNELGVRKHDIAAAWQRLKSLVGGPSTHNPKLVSYLASGSIRGLRPLRYEKRIARNRFIFLTLFFVVILWWMLGLFFSHR